MPRNGKKQQQGRPRAQRRGRRSPGAALFGASEITQARVDLKPVYGPVVRIARSVVYDLARVSTDGGFFFDWSLSDVPNSNEFSALFQQWRLDSAAITFTWRSANEANPVRPVFTMANDPFSSSAPSALTELLERPNRTWSPNAQRTVLQLAMRPQAIALSASGAGTGSLVINALAPRGQWYPASASSLSYGALLLWISGWATNAGTIQVKQDYMFSFRGPK